MGPAFRAPVGASSAALVRSRTTSSPAHHRHRPVLEAERTSVQRLTEQVLAAVAAEAPDLAERWRAQSVRVAPGVSEGAPGGLAGEGPALVHALVRGVAGDCCWQDDLVRAGWSLGAAGFRHGASLHATIRQVDLLEAMILYAIETAASRDDAGTAADGIALARRLQRARSLLLLATVKSFVEAYLGELRDRYRLLRHDLRNPLGTIRTAVSLMEDETIPAEMRSSPRFRAMVKRNASSIDALIGRRLADGVVHEEAFAWHDVPLGDLARAVRRELREDAAEAHCEIVPAPDLPVVRTDALGAELLLRTVVAAVLRAAAPRSEIGIAPAGGAAALEVRFERGPSGADAFAAGIALASELASQLRARVTADHDTVRVELPGAAAGGESLEDLSRMGERPY